MAVKVAITVYNNRGIHSAWSETTQHGPFLDVQAAEAFLQKEGFEPKLSYWRKGDSDPQPGEWTWTARLADS
jgi:hypothetical protein